MNTEKESQLNSNFEEVKKVIFEAFKNTKKGNGIGLWEGDALDNYASKEDQEIARAKDEHLEWFDITESWDYQISTAMSFVDKEGFVFLLPALMYTGDGTMVFFHLNTNMLGDTRLTRPNETETLEYLKYFKSVNPKQIAEYYKFTKEQIHAISVFFDWWKKSDDFFISGNKNELIVAEELRILRDWINLGA